MIGLRQTVGARTLVSALRLGDGGNLRQVRGIGHPLVALVFEEETVRRLGARAGETGERHCAVRILDGELQRGPQLVGVERTMAVSDISTCETDLAA